MKRVLVRMEGNDDLDMTNATTKFCVSWLTIQVIESAVHNFIAAWNSHRIPGSGVGIPNSLATCAPQTTALLPSLVPTVSEMYCQGGRRLTPEHTFGSNPITAHSELQHLRRRDFFHRYPDLKTLFSSTLHSDGAHFRDALLYFISLNNAFARLL